MPFFIYSQINPSRFFKLSLRRLIVVIIKTYSMLNYFTGKTNVSKNESIYYRKRSFIFCNIFINHGNAKIMSNTKKIIIIELILAFILSMYFFTSLFLSILYQSINTQSFEAKVWFLNFLTAVVLYILFFIIHAIIRRYSPRQVVENIKLHKFRIKNRSTIWFSMGLFFIIVPLVIILYLIFFIPEEIVGNLFWLDDFFIIIGITLLIIGAFKNGNRPDIRSESKTLPAPSNLNNKTSIVSRRGKKFVLIFLISWMVILLFCFLVFYLVFKINIIQIIIIVMIITSISFFIVLLIRVIKVNKNAF